MRFEGANAKRDRGGRERVRERERNTGLSPEEKFKNSRFIDSNEKKKKQKKYVEISRQS